MRDSSFRSYNKLFNGPITLPDVIGRYKKILMSIDFLVVFQLERDYVAKVNVDIRIPTPRSYYLLGTSTFYAIISSAWYST